MAIKNVTPARGTPTPSQMKKAEQADYQPRFRSDKPQKRGANPGRGNEKMSNDDVADSPANQRLTPAAQADKWARIPSAVAYLHAFSESIGTRDPAMVRQVVEGSIEVLRKYVEHLELQARNTDKKLTPTSSVQLIDKVDDFKEKIATYVKSPAEKIYDILRFTVIPEVFQDNDMVSTVIEGIGRVNIMDDLSVTIVGDNKKEKDENKEKFQKWLIANELEDMITQQVNAQTLGAFVRRTLKDPKSKYQLPMELIDLKPVTRAQITRA